MIDTGDTDAQLIINRIQQDEELRKRIALLPELRRTVREQQAEENQARDHIAVLAQALFRSESHTEREIGRYGLELYGQHPNHNISNIARLNLAEWHKTRRDIGQVQQNSTVT